MFPKNVNKHFTAQRPINLHRTNAPLKEDTARDRAAFRAKSQHETDRDRDLNHLAAPLRYLSPLALFSPQQLPALACEWREQYCSFSAVLPLFAVGRATLTIVLSTPKRKNADI